MTQNPASSYLRTKILTANPQELRLMLYEGAIRFCHQARKGLEEKNYELSYNGLMRAQKIVLELSTSLNHQVAPELCDKLGALYTYIYKLLVEANMSRQIKQVDEAIKLLEYERATWQMLMNRLNSDDPAAASHDHATGARQTAISSLSTSA
ncbi:MAG: flagellar export chaperone FliS [Phycisphaeraceae bacterium]|nr:flagellar export chaperone FliS [Phycisphaeraceae bacterium]